MEKFMEYTLRQADPEVADIMKRELVRQQETLVMIPSENYASRAVMDATGSIMTNKYAEGYPGARYYHGCENVDDVERLAIERACKLFGAEHANVQPVSGTQANMSAYFALLEHGDTVLAMALDQGGHLSHGNKINFSGKYYNFVGYGVDKDTEMIDYDLLAKTTAEVKPKMIIAGGSAYARTLDFARFREIADSVGAFLLVDMAHISGLIAGGQHENPTQYADIVTSTTHKTLRGPRAAFILCKEEYKKKIDKAVFPGIQAGPLMHTIAAKAVMFHEAASNDFKVYQKNVIDNAKALCEQFKERDLRIVSGDTDTHLMLVDLRKLGITGKEGANILREANIVANFNTIPYDPMPPAQGSGIRPGSPCLTTRGMGIFEMKTVANLIADTLENKDDANAIERIKGEVTALANKFPIYDTYKNEY